MRKRFAPLAILFGLLTALMLGSTAVAQATTILPTFDCNNVGGVNVVTCSETNVLNNITSTIVIQGNKVLSGNELVTLENVLNNNSIDIDVLNITTTVSQIEALTVSTYNSFNPPININVNDVNVNLCILSVCFAK